MKYNSLVHSPVAIELYKAIEEYCKESNKTTYRFTIEEQMEMERQIKILNNQLNALIEYELKKIIQRKD